MPFEISKYAQGLPGILGLKERGVGIPQLADQAVGIVDLRDLYLLGTRENILQTGLGVAVGGNTFSNLTVPTGELWYVWEFLISATMAAGTSIDMAPSYGPDGQAGSAVLAPFAAAAATQFVAAGSSRPLWCGPGTYFGVMVRSLVLAPTVGASLVITRLRV